MYYKTLKNALGIEAVSGPVYLKTIYAMYPKVKSILDEVCEAAKQEMKGKNEDELGSWKRAVTVADGTWQTRGWHSKNATFTIRNYLNGASPLLPSSLPCYRRRVLQGYIKICRYTHYVSEGQRGGDAGFRRLAGR